LPMKKIEPSWVESALDRSASVRVFVTAIVPLLSRRETHPACHGNEGECPLRSR
jgi:hypothetical protein